MKHLALFTILFLLLIVPVKAQTGQIEIVFDTVEFAQRMDTMRVKLRFNKDGQYISMGNLEKEEVGFVERNYNRIFHQYSKGLEYVGSANSVLDKLSVVFLVDRSVSLSNSALEKEKHVLSYLVRSIDSRNVSIYVSAMDGMVTPTKKIDNENELNQWMQNNLSSLSNSEKHLYEALGAKIEEMTGLSHECYPYVTHNKSLQDDSDKILVVLTNGKVKDDDGKFIGGSEFFKMKNFVISQLHSKMNSGKPTNIPTYVVYFGDEKDVKETEKELAMVNSAGNENVNSGGFVSDYSVASLDDKVVEIVQNRKTEYVLTFCNKDLGRLYHGQELFLELNVKNEYGEASGSTRYVLGNNLKPYINSPGYSKRVVSFYVLFYVIIGSFLFFFIVYLVVQYVVPRLNYSIFLKKYVKLYDRDLEGISENCCYCKQKFIAGDKVVTKCKHTVHWECWEENRERCPEYGNTCKTGYYYYNRDKLSDPRNTTPKRDWMMFGMVGAIFARILYQLIPYQEVLPNFIDKILLLLKFDLPDLDSPEMALTMLNFRHKIQGLAVFGFCVGFVMTFLIRSRLSKERFNVLVALHTFVHSCATALVCFFAFLIGSIVFVLFGKDYNCYWTDLVPWLCFGSVVMWLPTMKTQINFFHAAIPAVVASLLCYSMFYIIGLQEDMGVFFPLVNVPAIMVLGAGIGIGMAKDLHLSNKYFLHVGESIKGYDIAIYKWMSSSGGFRRVSVGKGMNCMIDMRWDDSNYIEGRQFELFVENDMPYCRVYTNNVKIGTDNICTTREEGDVVQLRNGTVIRIGKTTFTYIEKDK